MLVVVRAKQDGARLLVKRDCRLHQQPSRPPLSAKSDSQSIKRFRHSSKSATGETKVHTRGMRATRIE
jgi:hypothetical protein